MSVQGGHNKVYLCIDVCVCVCVYVRVCVFAFLHATARCHSCKYNLQGACFVHAVALLHLFMHLIFTHKHTPNHRTAASTHKLNIFMYVHIPI